MPSLSAFVITCDRPDVLAACLKRLRFVDELVLVDKGRKPVVADHRGFGVDVFHIAQWSPVVEDTRAYAQSKCSGDWIICLDDDEILCRAAGAVIRNAIANAGNTKLFYIPIHHWILGRYDERAYAPEWRPALYRRGAVSYQPVVHAGTNINCAPNEVETLPTLWIDHLSHANVNTYLEKTLRYTSQPARSGVRWLGNMTLRDYVLWRVAQNRDDPDQHVQAVELLRAMYEIIDMAKRWEDTQPNGREAFAAFCREVENEPG